MLKAPQKKPDSDCTADDTGHSFRFETDGVAHHSCGSGAQDHAEDILRRQHLRRREARSTRLYLIATMESRNGRSQLLHPGLIDSDDDVFPSTGRVQPTPVSVRQTSRRKDPSRHSHPKPPLTPSTGVPTSMPQNIPNPLISSAAAPASPPTPAPSPTPNQRPSIWTSPPEPVEDNVLQEATFRFSQLNVVGKEAWLAAIVDSCDNHLLSYLHQLVSPRLKKDPFQTLPNELCFRVRFSPPSPIIPSTYNIADSRIC